MKKFTLIELLVVVAIIGILTSMLLPALGKARLSAQKSVCVSNIKQIGTSMYIYGDDNDSHVVTAAVSGSITYSQQLSEDYGMSDAIFSCAQDKIERSNNRKTRSYSMNTGTSITFEGTSTPKDDSDCNGVTRMATYNTVSYSEIASDTLLLTELWENINYAHGWSRADMTWSYWNYMSDWTERLDAFHFGRPNYLLIDGSVKNRVHSTYNQGMFTRFAND